MNSRDELIEKIVSRQHETDEPPVETVDGAVSKVTRDFPALLDPDFALLTDRHIHRLIDGGTPEVEAITRGAREIAERFGMAERESEHGVSDEQREASAVIAEMAASRVGARAHE